MADITVDVATALQIEVEIIAVVPSEEGAVSFDYLKFPLRSPTEPNGVVMEFGTPGGVKYRSGKVGVSLNGQELISGVHFTEPVARLSIVLIGMDPPQAGEDIFIWLVQDTA